MLTPQEVSSHAFPKAMMSGYNMTAVDEFLDELTDDYTALYKENAGLKAKLKVLVEKVEEYRATEDSMRATLLTAQRMADSIVKEAEAKRDEILAQAETGAQDKVRRYQQDLAEAELRLQQGRQELAQFINAGKELCARELRFLEQLPALEVNLPAPPPAEDAPKVEEIEEKVMAAFAEQPVEATPPAATPEATPEIPAAEAENAPAEEPSEKDPFEDTRVINLDDLKFGRNYGGEEN